MRDGFHGPRLDFYRILRKYISKQGHFSLYDWAWNALNKEDETGTVIKDRFTGVEYRKMLVPNRIKCSTVYLGIPI